MLISVVIPMFNELESVRPLLERLEATLRPLDIPFEIRLLGQRVQRRRLNAGTFVLPERHPGGYSPWPPCRS